MVKKNAPRMGHLPIQWVLQLHVGHLNSFLELRDGNLTAKNQKVQMPGGLPPGGRLQIDWCISHVHCMLDRLTSESHSEGTPLNIKSRLSIQYALRVGIIQVTHTVINGISMLSVVCILWDPRRIGLVNSRDGNLGIKCFLL